LRPPECVIDEVRPALLIKGKAPPRVGQNGEVDRRLNNAGSGIARTMRENFATR